VVWTLGFGLHWIFLIWTLAFFVFLSALWHLGAGLQVFATFQQPGRLFFQRLFLPAIMIFGLPGPFKFSYAPPAHFTKNGNPGIIPALRGFDQVCRKVLKNTRTPAILLCSPGRAFPLRIRRQRRYFFMN